MILCRRTALFVYGPIPLDYISSMGNVVEVEHRGRFVKPCPGTPDHVCCGYRIIHFAEGCTLDCTYCVLTSYFDHENILLFGNRHDLFAELREVLEKARGLLRFGTGEFTDSLLMEKSHPLHADLIDILGGHPPGVLEIKTKTTCIDPLLDIPDTRNAIVAWSLNGEKIAREEESGAPAVEERIEAARRAQEAGFKLAFHFDPIILHEGWEEEYSRIVERLFERIRPEHVVYISMGALRFPSDMREALEKRGARYIHSGEFVRGRDNKMRYFRPLRTRLFTVIRDRLLRHVPEKKLYLCMESPEVWEDVFGIRRMTSRSLADRLDRACAEAFPWVECADGEDDSSLDGPGV
jgi:spore photoproduct lyase